MESPASKAPQEMASSPASKSRTADRVSVRRDTRTTFEGRDAVVMKAKSPRESANPVVAAASAAIRVEPSKLNPGRR